MKTPDRYKLLDIVNSIKENNFRYIDINNLLIMIRDNMEQRKYPFLHDLTNFVAHNQDRVKGVIHDGVMRKRTWECMRVDIEKQKHLIYNNIECDPNIPNLVYDYLDLIIKQSKGQHQIHGVKITDLKGLLSRIKKQQESLEDLMKSLSGSERYCLNKLLFEDSPEQAKTYTQIQFFEDLSNCLKDLHFDFPNDVCQEIQQKVTLSVLMMMHGTYLEWNGKFQKLELVVFNNTIHICWTFIVIKPSNHGLSASLHTTFFGVFTSEILADEVTDPELLKHVLCGSHTLMNSGRELIVQNIYPDNIHLSNDFKIIEAKNDYKNY